MPKKTPVTAVAKETTAKQFAKLLANECREHGIRSTARRCKMAHTSLVKMASNPNSIRADVLDVLASKLGYKIAVAKVEK